MAFVGQSPAGHAVWDKLAAQSGFDLRRLDGDAVFRMLHGLVLEEEGLAAAIAVPPPPSPEVNALAERSEAEQSLAGLDVAGLQEAIVQRQPPAPARVMVDAETPLQGRLTGDAAAVAIMKAALAEERSRTAALRGNIDTLRIALAQSEGRLAHFRQQRDLWRHRARVLTTALCDDLDGPADAEEAPTSTVGEEIRPHRAVA